MYLDAILEVAIGLVVVWFVISVAASQFQEFFADLLKVRSKFLRKRMEEMLGGKSLVDRLYSHTLINSLGTSWLFFSKRDPADIPKEIFIQAFVETFGGADEAVNSKPATDAPEPGKDTSKPVPNLQRPQLQKLQKEHPRGTAAESNPSMSTSLSPKMVTALLSKKDANGKTDTKTIEIWFDAKMKEASAVYHRQAAGISFLFGFVLAIILNVDTVHIANQLWKDPTLRQSLVAEAGKVTPESLPTLEDTLAKINSLAIPIGWNSVSGSLLSRIIGWLITGLAAAQGGPFWFDILRKLVSAKSQPAQPPQPASDTQESKPVG